MDPSAEQIDGYRHLLRHDLPPGARLTLEWLLVDAARDRASLEPAAPSLAPALVAVAQTAVAEAVRLTDSQFGNMQLYLAPQDTLCLLAHRNLAPAFASRFAMLRPD